MSEKDLRLPVELWHEVSDVLKLVVLAQYGESAAPDGQYVADALAPFMARVEVLVRSERLLKDWRPENRGRVRWALGASQEKYGEQKGDNAALHKAIETLRRAADDFPRSTAWAEWARCQVSLERISLQKIAGL